MYNWFSSLKKRYVEGVDYSFPDNQSRLYEDMIWLSGDKPSLDDFNLMAEEDTNSLMLESVRSQRNQLLQETDWIVIKARETNTNVPATWKTYRQALRDITSQTDNWSWNSNGDLTINWPTKPE